MSIDVWFCVDDASEKRERKKPEQMGIEDDFSVKRKRHKHNFFRKRHGQNPKKQKRPTTTMATICSAFRFLCAI